VAAFHRREDVARYAAPAAFLVAITILVLLVRAGLTSGGGNASVQTLPVSTAAAPIAPVTTPLVTTLQKPAKRFYAIQRGDTFSIVARKLNTTVEALQALNPGVSSSALTIGQQIRVK
jgi:LysM repeat protein